MPAVTFLTGASSGIGHALAPLLAEAGYPVALAARRLEPLEQLADTIRSAGGTALPLACDVADGDSVRAAVERCTRELGPIDLLIANAGMGRPSAAHAFCAADLEETFRTNVFGVAHCIEAVLPGMLARGGGHLVGVSSPGGWRGLPGSGFYSSSKAALTNLLESLRVELAPRGIAVTTIEPGFVRTPMTAQNDFSMPFLVEPDDAARRILAAIRRRRRVYAFPWPLIAAMRVIRQMPPALYDRLLAAAAPK